MEPKDIQYKENRATAHLEKAFSDLFRDHEELSAFIMEKGGLDMSLNRLRKEAKMRKFGCNDNPARWLRRFVEAMKDEVSELEASIPWKWWKKEQVDMQNVRVEIIDIFHFILSAAAASGMTGEDFINIYYQKRRINFDRQVTGYKKGDNLEIGTDRF